MNDGLAVFGVAVAILCVYFLPAIVAAAKKRTNSFAIFVLNLFVGWTFIGWIGTLVWALTEGRKA